MSVIERSIEVSYKLRVSFTQHVFDPANLVLMQALENPEAVLESSRSRHKVLVVLDESLAKAQPDLPQRIETYFAAHADRVCLVCPPFVIEGGERTKNSYF